MYATFALREQVGGRGSPYLNYWILEDDENWHDVIRGDGGSYRPGGPKGMRAKKGESKEAFAARIMSAAAKWERFYK